jgi:hypothetical protein
MEHTIDVETKISNGDYESKLPYPEEHHSKEEKQKMRLAVREDTRRLFKAFKTDALQACGLASHPKADKIFDFVDSNADDRLINKYLMLEELADLL